MIRLSCGPESDVHKGSDEKLMNSFQIANETQKIMYLPLIKLHTNRNQLFPFDWNYINPFVVLIISC